MAAWSLVLREHQAGHSTMSERSLSSVGPRTGSSLGGRGKERPCHRSFRACYTQGSFLP
jgi:hypothetical protein